MYRCMKQEKKLKSSQGYVYWHHSKNIEYAGPKVQHPNTFIHSTLTHYYIHVCRYTCVNLILKSIILAVWAIWVNIALRLSSKSVRQVVWLEKLSYFPGQEKWKSILASYGVIVACQTWRDMQTKINVIELPESLKIGKFTAPFPRYHSWW